MFHSVLKNTKIAPTYDCSRNKKAFLSKEGLFWWGEQDSNLRS